MARVSPIPKVVNPTSMNELRPISILPVLSKVFEKAVGIQIMSFAERASLLHEGLSSFRKVHSTTTALLGMRDDIRKAMDKGEVTLMVMADFSKTFDTICFRTTLLKLHKLGFTKPSLKWLLSYLCDCCQFVQIDDKSSSCQTIAFGIPQGSILGPIIFNLYVSDLKDVIPASIKFSRYAYDTTLCHHTPVQDLAGGVSLMNNALSELHSWFKESNLALNPDKTKSMMFSTRQMFTRRNLSSFPLLLSAGGKDLERIKNTKLNYLASTLMRIFFGMNTSRTQHHHAILLSQASGKSNILLLFSPD